MKVRGVAGNMNLNKKSGEKFISFFLLIFVFSLLLPGKVFSSEFRRTSFSQNWFFPFFLYSVFAGDLLGIENSLKSYGGGFSLRYHFSDLGKIEIWDYGGFIFSFGGRTTLNFSLGGKKDVVKGDKVYNLGVFDIEGDFLSFGFSWQFAVILPKYDYIHFRMNLDLLNIGGGLMVGDFKIKGDNSNVDLGEYRRIVLNIPIVPLTPTLFLSYNGGNSGFGIFGGANLFSLLSFVSVQEGSGANLKTIRSRFEFMSREIKRFFIGITIDF